MARSALFAFVLGAGVAAAVAVGAAQVLATDSVFTVPTNQLLSDAEFGAKAWGPGTLVSRAAAPGGAVDFTFTGLGTSGTGVKDDYPVDPVYGQVIPSHGNGDFSGFTGYALRLENLDDSPVWAQLCINTGFTGPSGTPPSDLTNNTFWTCSPGWRELWPGEDLLVILDFDGAIAYQISDNKVPHSGGGLGWPDGGVYVINDFDRAELSAIGFEIADFSGTNPNAVLRLTPVSADAGVGIGIPPSSGGAVQAGPVLRVYPNPGRAVSISIALAPARQAAEVPAELAVYDIHGRLVRSLWEGRLDAGSRELEWDGNDIAGANCAPGMYLLRLAAGRESRTEPVLLVR